jgi:nitrate reductase NapAB chaperone NapD
MCEPTGKVIVLIVANSQEEALDQARKMKNFQIDEEYGAVSIVDGEYYVRGIVTGPIS